MGAYGYKRRNRDEDCVGTGMDLGFWICLMKGQWWGLEMARDGDCVGLRGQCGDCEKTVMGTTRGH